MRQYSELGEMMTHSEANHKPKFKVKDTESNEVFERKVIYELKKEN